MAAAITGLTGDTVIDCKLVLLTVMVAVPLIPPNWAVIVVLPDPGIKEMTPLASPLLPATLLTVAIEGSAVTQAADAVTSCVVLSLKLAVACNCKLVPWAMLG